ncbi:MULTISPECIES: hydrogenase/urease maturation nickel metallochaperone HypA [Candidatus Nitrosocaldus]|nr:MULTISPECIES: hydrogenase/urease maturation nickel metallochaperone HypA [Candidatus Nitrosocaldus]
MSIIIMHELALIKDIITRLEAIAIENNARRIRSIRLRFGALTHTPAEIFKEQFRMMATAEGKSILDGTKIEIEVADEIDDDAQDVILESVELEQ